MAFAPPRAEIPVADVVVVVVIVVFGADPKVNPEFDVDGAGVPFVVANPKPTFVPAAPDEGVFCGARDAFAFAPSAGIPVVFVVDTDPKLNPEFDVDSAEELAFVANPKFGVAFAEDVFG